MDDPLAPFLKSLWHTVVPIGIAAVVVGSMLGMFARGAANWFVGFVRRLQTREDVNQEGKSPDDRR